MARLNIEDCWWTDPRRELLADKLGSFDIADIAVVRAWRVAQEFWKHGKLVPEEIFNTLKHGPALLEARLAEKRNGAVYVRGSSQYLDWVKEAREQGKLGGQKSAEARRKKHGTAQPTANGRKPRRVSEPPSNPPSENTPNTFEASEPSVSGSFSVSVSDSKKNSVRTNAGALVPAQELPGRTFVGVYVKAYQARYGDKTRPEISGKVAGEIKRFLAGTPLPRACELIQVYLQMDEPWFKTKCHDFTTFAANLNKVSLALDTGAEQGGINWEKVFEAKP